MLAPKILLLILYNMTWSDFFFFFGLAANESDE